MKLTYKTYKQTKKAHEARWCLPRNLKHLRQTYGVSLGDMAKWTGISKAYLSQLENGQSAKPSVACAAALAFFWEMTIEQICFEPLI